MREVQKRREERNRRAKKQEVDFWGLLGDPVYDSPLRPEALFSAGAPVLATRGRSRTMETAWLGGNVDERAIGRQERSSRENGSVGEEANRLGEYANALADYGRVLRKLKARR